MDNVDVLYQDHRHLFNRLDNRVFYNAIIVADPVLSTLITRYLDLGPFTGEIWSCLAIPAMCHIITYVRYKIMGNDDPDMVKVQAGAMGECLGPGIPAEHFCEREDARNRITAVGIWIRDHIQQMGDVTRATAGNYVEFNNNLQGVVGHNFPVLEGAIVFPIAPGQGENDGMTPMNALRLIYHCAHYASEWSTNYSLTTLVHVHAAVAKQGNITTKFIQKVKNGISSDLQVDLDISSSVVKVFWNVFRLGITDESAPIIFRVWETWIPAQALRMRLVVGQCAMTGLLVLSAIGKALRLFPDFPWARVFCYLPSEATAFATAAVVVGGNQYYGYRKDLGCVKSTNYKNLGWVAYRVLVRGNNETTLNGYKGWPRTILHQAELQAIIDDYFEGREEHLVDDARIQVKEQQLANIMATINDAGNAAVYA